MKIELTDEQTEFVVQQELEFAYKLHKKQEVEYQDEEFLAAVVVMLEYFMGVSKFNEWKRKNND
jgi:hypothetical protein